MKKHIITTAAALCFGLVSCGGGGSSSSSGGGETKVQSADTAALYQEGLGSFFTDLTIDGNIVVDTMLLADYDKLVTSDANKYLHKRHTTYSKETLAFENDVAREQWRYTWFNAGDSSWKTYSDPNKIKLSITVNADKTITNEIGDVTRSSVIDLEGKFIKDYVDAATIAHIGGTINPTAKFSAGAKQVTLTNTVIKQRYGLWGPYGDLPATLAELKAKLNNGESVIVGWSGPSLPWADYTATVTSGTVTSGTLSLTSNGVDKGEATYQEKTVGGRPVMVITLPPALTVPRRTLILADDLSGELNFGAIEEPGDDIWGPTVKLNLTAIHDVAAAIEGVQIITPPPPPPPVTTHKLRVHYYPATINDGWGIRAIAGLTNPPTYDGPDGRTLFDTSETNGVFITFYYQEGATSFEFKVLDANGSESCNQPLFFPLAGKTQDVDVYVSGCSVTTTPVITGELHKVRIHLKGASLTDNWGIWTWAGSTSPMPVAWPDDRILFDATDSWGVVKELEYAQGTQKLDFVIVNGSGVKTCGPTDLTVPLGTTDMDVYVGDCSVTTSLPNAGILTAKVKAAKNVKHY